MPFGLSPNPAKFQKFMDTVTQDLKGIACFQDDIIVTGKNKEEHRENLIKLFERLNEYGIKVKIEKCQFYRKEVQYLGHTIDQNGKRPTD